MPIWAFSLIPLTALVLGAIAATVRAPGAMVTSGVQHFAAGLVFAASGLAVFLAFRTLAGTIVGASSAYGAYLLLLA